MAKATISVPVSGYLKNKVLDKERHDGQVAGKSTGLRLVHFVTAMFLANEKQKQPDSVLEATLKAEFPKRASHQAIPTWRAYHNGSKHGMNEDGVHSVRYGDDGQPARRAAAASNGKGKGKGKGKAAAKAKGKAGSKPRKSKSEQAAGEPATA